MCYNICSIGQGWELSQSLFYDWHKRILLSKEIGMAKKNTATAVRELLLPVVEGMGYMLWDVEYVKIASEWHLIITIDTEDGINIEDCERVHRAIDPILDEADPIENSYRLEVSSPGIERELRTEEHIEFCLGMDVEAKLFAAKDGKKSFVGILADCADGIITVETADGEVKLNRNEISKLSTVYDFG